MLEMLGKRSAWICAKQDAEDGVSVEDYDRIERMDALSVADKVRCERFMSKKKKKKKKSKK